MSIAKSFTIGGVEYTICGYAPYLKYVDKTSHTSIVAFGNVNRPQKNADKMSGVYINIRDKKKRYCFLKFSTIFHDDGRPIYKLNDTSYTINNSSEENRTMDVVYSNKIDNNITYGNYSFKSRSRRNKRKKRF